jgi:hypothetical protein
MALLGISLAGGALRLAADGGDPEPALEALLPALPRTAPLAILIHGYRYDPALPAHDPHRLLFALDPERRGRRIASWPRGLGFSAGGLEDGLCIGFGWPARPALRHPGGAFGEAYARAGAAGAELARLIGLIAGLAPGRKVDMVAHSLGARVALSAYSSLPHEAVAAASGRLILLGGAEFAGRAAAALGAAPPGAAPEVYSVTARHNDPFDALFERFAPRGPGADHVLGRAAPRLRNWLTLQLDHPALRGLAAMHGIGLEPAGPVCHWGFFTAPGALSLYARILREREVWSPAALAGTAAALDPEPRWSRLLIRPRRPGAGGRGAIGVFSRRARGT